MRVSLRVDEEAMTMVDGILDRNQSVGAGVVKILDPLWMHRIDRGLMKMMRKGGERTRPNLDAVGVIATTAIDAATMTAIDATLEAIAVLSWKSEEDLDATEAIRDREIEEIGLHGASKHFDVPQLIYSRITTTS